MSKDEDAEKGFLSRWSQRKRAAKRPDVDDVSVQADQEAKESSAIADSDTEEAFDLSSLPTLEEITGTTDISAFLHKGVPESMRNAALRKSWALDPAIRNYVNPALDYAYDWNTPGGVPGSGELGTGIDVAKMVGQIMGSTSSSKAAVPNTQQVATLHHNDAAQEFDDYPRITAPQNPEPAVVTEPARLSEAPHSLPPSSEDSMFSSVIATDGSDDNHLSEPGAAQQPLRRHGSAKPRL